jgi:hypothetical protein
MALGSGSRRPGVRVAFQRLVLLYRPKTRTNGVYTAAALRVRDQHVHENASDHQSRLQVRGENCERRYETDNKNPE